LEASSVRKLICDAESNNASNFWGLPVLSKTFTIAVGNK
jgi:hypothetical protein